MKGHSHLLASHRDPSHKGGPLKGDKGSRCEESSRDRRQREEGDGSSFTAGLATMPRVLATLQQGNSTSSGLNFNQVAKAWPQSAARKISRDPRGKEEGASGQGRVCTGSALDQSSGFQSPFPQGLEMGVRLSYITSQGINLTH